ncbi:molybdate ABC transporter substrate-binding protein, partial [Methylobacterium frigidaeris]
MRRTRALWTACLLLLAAPASAAEPATVFAAASLKNALDEAGKAFTAESGIPVRSSYAASSALARQIEQGAPADLFASADLEWMDYLAARKLIRPETRLNLLANRLVVVAPRSAQVSEAAFTPDWFARALGPDGRLATGEVSSVP